MIRNEMAAEGWDSDDKITRRGWGDRPGYSVWFTRYDWHGQRTLVLIGAHATYHGHTPDISRAIEAVRKGADLARRAWAEFPDIPPTQSEEGMLLPSRRIRP